MAFIIQSDRRVLGTLQLIWIQQSIRNVILRLFFDKFIDVMLGSVFGC